MKYEDLKLAYKNSKNEFSITYGTDVETIKLMIEVLAKADYDNGWPLDMLEAIIPQFANALRFWTAGGFEDYRNAQKGICRKATDIVTNFENHFHLLPLWQDKVRHYSKDKSWLHKCLGEKLTLDSQMSCCKRGYKYAYALDYSAVLVFNKLKTARLVGSLSTENCEGEVLLPKGSTFEVISINYENKIILINEV